MSLLSTSALFGIAIVSPAAAQTLSESTSTATWDGQVTGGGGTVQTSGSNYTTSGAYPGFTQNQFTVTMNAPITAFRFRVLDWGTCCHPTSITYSLDGGPEQTWAVRNASGGPTNVYLGLSGATPFTTITIRSISTGDVVSADSIAYSFVDTTPPTLNITGPVATQTAPFTVNFSFSENVTNFTAGDVSVTNGTLSGFSGSGSAYSATITPAADGLVSLNVAAGTYEDTAGNDNTAASSYSVQADVSLPTATASGPAGPVNAPFVANFVFSESVSNFLVGDITVVNGTASAFSGSGANYSATITPAASGAVQVSLNAGIANDTAGNGNQTSNTFSVVADLTPPVITTPGTLNVNTDAGQPTAVVNYTVTANDPGNGALTPTLVSGPASGSAFPIGTTTISYTVTDAAGNTTNASFNVVVSDAEDPTINGLPANISVNTDPGLPTAVVSWTPPTAGDNAPGATITQTAGPASGSAFPIGVTTITYEAEDAAGNTTTLSFTVTVADAEPPAFTGFPANISITVDYPTTSATASWTAPGVTDNAPGSTVTQIAGQASGSSFALGTHTITYRAEDDAGNIVDRSFTVTVQQTPPGQVRLVIQTGEDGDFVFTSPEPGFNLTISTLGGDGDATVNIRPGVFNLAFALPAGFGIVSADCNDANSSLDESAKTGVLNVGSNELITCTIVTVDSLTETSRLVGAFMGARAQLIMQNMPDADRRIDRLSGRTDTPNGVSAFGVNMFRTDAPFDLSLGEGHANFSFSLAGMRAQQAQNRTSARDARARWGDGEYDAEWGANPRERSFAGYGQAQDGWVDPEQVAAGFASGATSAPAIEADAPQAAVGDRPLPGQQRLDVWVEGAYAQFDTTIGDGDFYMLSVGADYIANENLLLGVAAQFDWTDMSGELPNSSISGAGFLVGPYVTARMAEGLYFDAQLALGQSDNQVSPFGLYEDDVEADRVFASAALIGDIRSGPWTIRPEGRVSYFREETEAYVDSLSVAIPAIAVETGTFEFSPTISYRYELADDSVFEPFASLEGIWTFSQKNTAAFALGNDAFLDEGLRGRFEAGFDFVQSGGMQLQATGFYDGIGSSNEFESWGAQLRLSWSFDPE